MGDTLSVLYCRTLSDGVGAEETDGATVVELEGGGGDEGEPKNGEKGTTVATVDLLAKCKGGRIHRIINKDMLVYILHQTLLFYVEVDLACMQD